MTGKLRILVLEGDGVGPEVAGQALRVLDVAAHHAGLRLETTTAAFGGGSIDRFGVPATEEVLALAAEQDAVFLGAVGGQKWDDLPADRRPEKGLLQLRSTLGVYANLRPARCFESLVEGSPLRGERIAKADFVVVRELIGGIYFGEPRGITATAKGLRGFNTMIYEEAEIRRVGRLAFALARRRGGRLTSVDKANVLEVSMLWRGVIGELAAEYPDVELSHLYVDNCAMQLVRDPRQFDVLVTGNLFGDILSDISGALTGSLGMLPSASLGEGTALYEPVHGSAPDIAGKGMANPLAAILSAAMLLEHTARRPDLAAVVQASVEDALNQGLRTPDLVTASPRVETVGTEQMGSAVVAHLERRLRDEPVVDRGVSEGASQGRRIVAGRPE